MPAGRLACDEAGDFLADDIVDLQTREPAPGQCKANHSRWIEWIRIVLPSMYSLGMPLFASCSTVTISDGVKSMPLVSARTFAKSR